MTERAVTAKRGQCKSCLKSVKLDDGGLMVKHLRRSAICPGTGRAPTRVFA